MRKQAVTAIALSGAAYADDSAIVDDSWAMRGPARFCQDQFIKEDDTKLTGQVGIGGLCARWRFL